MKSIGLFFKFIIEALKDFKLNFGMYLPVYISFLLINFLMLIPWEFFGYQDKSGPEIIIAIIAGLLSLVCVTNVILIEKSRMKMREKEKLLYAAPTYLIYTLYSSLIILVFFSTFFLLPKTDANALQGASLSAILVYLKFAVAAIPAILAGVCVAMLPLASVLIDNDNANYFKLSLKLARKSPALVFLMGASSIFIEVPSVAIDLLPNLIAQTAAGFVYAFFDGILIIVLTKASVAIFYYLKKQIFGEAVYSS